MQPVAIYPLYSEPFQHSPQPKSLPVSRGPIIAPTVSSVSGLYNPYAADGSRHPLRMEIAPSPPPPVKYNLVIQNPIFGMTSIKAYCTQCNINHSPKLFMSKDIYFGFLS